MVRNRKIFKVDEEKLREMMASESISCVSSGTVADETLPVSVNKENAKESIDNHEGGNTDCNTLPVSDKAYHYGQLFLKRKNSVQRKQTYISIELYRKLARILPLLSDDISIPSFLDNVLTHHLETYSKELGELFRRKTQKPF
ncbi:DUF3408 domain-containing protein [Bacteroides uniformis]|uniref:DUF3408 domain-containing protein n=1 Tax=Bacteroidales TaxID=171549 RepID=UPI001D09713B|nr:DUF3408 domain-containing protein [Bacteroides uniformis]MCB7028064.1 DUF3408 domain-containing protein [Bacteroides uniformis]